VEGERAVEHALDDAATREDPRRSDSPDAWDCQQGVGHDRGTNRFSTVLRGV